MIIGSPHQCSCLQKNKKNHQNNKQYNSTVSQDLSSTDSTDNVTTTTASTSTSVTADNPQPPLNQSVNEKWCKHLLFCLIKVLKVPKDHPLCYQTSLTDSEISQVLNGLQQDYNSNNNATRTRLIRSAKLKEKKEVMDEINTNFVQRQAMSDITDENSCPICQDVMVIDTQNLTWCRTGCGNNIHSKCMLQYCQFKISSKQTPCCPLCRDEWNMDLLKEDCKKKLKSNSNYSNNDANDKYKCSTLYCSNCTCLLRTNQFFRCLECSSKTLKNSRKVTDYCSECFTAGTILNDMIFNQKNLICQ